MRNTALSSMGLIAFILLIHTSCKPTFSTSGPWRDTTVVYGILDVKDTAHYIRIYKGYLNPKVSALTIAKIADSIYYPAGTITATIKQLNVNNDTVASFPLSRVDGNLEGYVMDTGIFASAPNILYKTKATLYGNTPYVLVITNNKTGKKITSQTMSVDTMKAYYTTYFYPHKNSEIIWYLTNNAAIYDLNITVHYKEITNTNLPHPDTTSKSITWNIFDNYTPPTGSSYDYSIHGTQFYNTMANQISSAQNNMARFLTGIDFSFAAGGNELNTYYLSQIANSGITQGQVIKGYTNVQHGAGLFSSRSHLNFKNVQVDANTRDTLACWYPLLGFQNSKGKLASGSCQ